MMSRLRKFEPVWSSLDGSHWVSTRSISLGTKLSPSMIAWFLRLMRLRGFVEEGRAFERFFNGRRLVRVYRRSAEAVDMLFYEVEGFVQNRWPSIVLEEP